jgi:hypothetical protein
MRVSTPVHTLLETDCAARPKSCLTQTACMGPQQCYHQQSASSNNYHRKGMRAVTQHIRHTYVIITTAGACQVRLPGHCHATMTSAAQQLVNVCDVGCCKAKLSSSTLPQRCHLDPQVKDESHKGRVRSRQMSVATIPNSQIKQPWISTIQPTSVADPGARTCGLPRPLHPRGCGGLIGEFQVCAPRQENCM